MGLNLVPTTFLLCDLSQVFLPVSSLSLLLSKMQVIIAPLLPVCKRMK